MSGAEFQSAPPADIPPIVVLADDDRGTLELYSTSLEAAGVWAATVTTPEEALATIDDLAPDLVVTDIAFSGGQEGTALVHALKDEPATAGIPVIVLTGRAVDDLPPLTRREADLVLTKPVLPRVLLTRMHEVLDRCRVLRAKSSSVQERTARLRQKSARLHAESARLNPLVESRSRPCPSCGGPLEWLERGEIGGIEYDYYRWCGNGCGLYCCERGARAARHWVKLA